MAMQKSAGKKTAPAKKNASKSAANAAVKKRTKAPTKKVEKEGGPNKWFLPIMEAAYSRLVPIDEPELRPIAAPTAFSMTGAKRKKFVSSFQENKGEEVLSTPTQEHWVDVLAEYKQRKAASVQATRARLGMAPMPGPIIPGQKNWAPLGPSVVTNGQAVGFPSVGGRIAGIAIDNTGQVVYAATANGGVFRSKDAGMTWKSMMDAFDIDPQSFASTSLACGAIAIDKNDPRRVYVGTGEGNTFFLFQNRLTNALPAYRGIGPIRSDDGGENWILEKTAAASPTLAGKSFFALAVDPSDRENVVAATSEGLYQRISLGGTGEWKLLRAGVYSTVVVASAGSTVFYAANWGKEVVSSKDGKTWTPLTTGFPASNVGRIELAVQPTDPNILYAIVANTKGALNGIFRYDRGTSTWKNISNPPDVLPADENGRGQGDYDLAIAVDPLNVNIIYTGGSYYNDPQFWPASIWRSVVTKSGSGYSMTSDPIGQKVHADVHVLVHSPGDANALWTGTDGGIFLNRNPRSSDNFASRNNGLGCLCCNFIAQHPTDPAILFSGLQDNGTARTGGGQSWKNVCGGDGGYCHINWAKPDQVLVFANGGVYRATDGGMDQGSWSFKDFPWAMMTEPIVGPPYNPTKLNEAEIVALASAAKNTGEPMVYLSNDFGATWPKQIPIPSQGGIYSMTFASAKRLFVGTTRGEVFRVDLAGSQWQVSQINNVAAGSLVLRGLVSDIAIDWTDPTTASIYITFGGNGDFRHVWHFDGVQWMSRSGQPNQKNLLDVEHNAIAVDSSAPTNVYVGADIGVWHSADSGATWEPLPNGLPDAPIFDLQIHPTRRLLRAATHGRGVFEFAIK
jgi:hypothetical protein